MELDAPQKVNKAKTRRTHGSLRETVRPRIHHYRYGIRRKMNDQPSIQRERVEEKRRKRQKTRASQTHEGARRESFNDIFVMPFSKALEIEAVSFPFWVVESGVAGQKRGRGEGEAEGVASSSLPLNGNSLLPPSSPPCLPPLLPLPLPSTALQPSSPLVNFIKGSPAALEPSCPSPTRLLVTSTVLPLSSVALPGTRGCFQSYGIPWPRRWEFVSSL